jgi:hypothetical protein
VPNRYRIVIVTLTLTMTLTMRTLLLHSLYIVIFFQWKQLKQHSR